MELPCRDCGDELLRSGEMTGLRQRMRNIASRHDLSSVIACAFDHRSRMLPFNYLNTTMAPAGVRAIGSMMVDIGLPKTRIVLQQWNRNFRPTLMRLDGKVPDLFMVSSLSMHFARCEDLIRDACRIDPARRPLIIAGGAKVIYEPWDVFSADPDDQWGADVAVTGEEYVLLSLLEAILSFRAGNESMRSAFQRARDQGALDEIPGLVYPKTDGKGVTQELVDTGIQRLLGDLDELPDPVLGYGILEPPSGREILAAEPIKADRVRKSCRFAAIPVTQGCRFSCSFCPIPAYNQRQVRAKSGERVAEEISQISYRYGIGRFFMTDDNFFVDEQRTRKTAEALERYVDADSFRIAWNTQATIHDTIRMKDLLPVLRKTGLRTLWLGVEDLSGALVKKGQTGDRTAEAFSILRQNGIYPMPMLIHHDRQPLISWRGNHGLLNQLHFLRKAGAIWVSVTLLLPSPGSKLYRECFDSGLAFKSVGGVPIEPVLWSATYTIATSSTRPWIRQLNLLAAYFFFFNLLRVPKALVISKSAISRPNVEAPLTRFAQQNLSRWKKFRLRLIRDLRTHFYDAGLQFYGMWGLLQMLRRKAGWILKLMHGKIERCSQPPASRIPMRSVNGGPASHALPGTPVAGTPNHPGLGGVEEKAV
ncbi:MAG: B12-binding domain-containing radical SAM protein [Syntrophobacteraceae bacterium]